MKASEVNLDYLVPHLSRVALKNKLAFEISSVDVSRVGEMKHYFVTFLNSHDNEFLALTYDFKGQVIKHAGIPLNLGEDWNIIDMGMYIKMLDISELKTGTVVRTQSGQIYTVGFVERVSWGGNFEWLVKPEDPSFSILRYKSNGVCTGTESFNIMGVKVED